MITPVSSNLRLVFQVSLVWGVNIGSEIYGVEVSVKIFLILTVNQLVCAEKNENV